MKKVISLVVLFLVLSVSTIIEAQVTSVDCGDSLSGEFIVADQIDQYTIVHEPGGTFTVTAIPGGQTLKIEIAITDAAGNGVAFGNAPRNLGEITSIETPVLASSRPFSIFVSNNDLTNRGTLTCCDNFGLGEYTIQIDCTSAIPRSSPTPEPTSIVPEPTACNYCFPGVRSVNFEGGIELPLPSGRPQVAPVGNDVVVLYTYDTTASSTATLSISRISGNISIGVAVINQANNEIMFIGGMPTSNNLSVELMFPEDGTYVIGLFQLETPTLTGTSGAVQVLIE